jgi:hypothetical protein
VLAPSLLHAACSWSVTIVPLQIRDSGIEIFVKSMSVAHEEKVSTFLFLFCHARKKGRREILLGLLFFWSVAQGKKERGENQCSAARSVLIWHSAQSVKHSLIGSALLFSQGVVNS